MGASKVAMAGDVYPGLVGNNCVPDIFAGSARAAFRWTCAVCDDPLDFDEQSKSELLCKGCKTAIKTFRAAIGS